MLMGMCVSMRMSLIAAAMLMHVRMPLVAMAMMAIQIFGQHRQWLRRGLYGGAD